MKIKFAWFERLTRMISALSALADRPEACVTIKIESVDPESVASFMKKNSGALVEHLQAAEYFKKFKQEYEYELSTGKTGTLKWIGIDLAAPKNPEMQISEMREQMKFMSEDWAAVCKAVTGTDEHVNPEDLIPIIEKLRTSKPSHVDQIAEYESFVDGQWERRRRPEVELMPQEMQSLRNLFIMTCGIGGEAGEVQELLKKHIRDDVLDKKKLVLELGDVLYYTTRIASFFGSNLREVMRSNQAKLIDRNLNGKREDVST